MSDGSPQDRPVHFVFGVQNVAPVTFYPDISLKSVETRTALPMKRPNIEVSNLDERAGNVETKRYSAKGG